MKLAFLLCILLFAVNVYSKECSFEAQNTILKDLVFKITPDGKLEVSSKKNLLRENVTTIVSSINNKKINAKIQLKNTQGKVCEEIVLAVDPTLLCRDLSGAIEPWTYWLYQEGPDTPIEYSVVSAYSDIGEGSALKRSRICGYNKISGNVAILNSNISCRATTSGSPSKIVTGGAVLIEDSDVSGVFTIQDNVNAEADIVIENSQINGDVTIKASRHPIYIKDTNIWGAATMIENYFEPDNLNNFSIYMDRVQINGSPVDE